MTIKPSNAYQTYICTGGEREFPFSFPVYAEHHLIVRKVLENGTFHQLILGTDYRLTGVGNETGGCVILTYDALAGERYNLILSVPEERLNDYAVNRPVSPELLNKELDILVQCLQSLRRDVKRCPNIELGQTWDEMLSSIYAARNHAQQSEANISNTENACNQIKDQMGQMNAEALAAMKEAGSVWVPTLSTVGNLRGKGRFSEPDVQAILESALQNVVSFSAMGGLLAPGTDAEFGAPGGVNNNVIPGLDLKTCGVKIVDFLSGAELNVHNFCFLRLLRSAQDFFFHGVISLYCNE